jgi:hypothetical protein
VSYTVSEWMASGLSPSALGIGVMISRKSGSALPVSGPLQQHRGISGDEDSHADGLPALFAEFVEGLYRRRAGWGLSRCLKWRKGDDQVLPRGHKSQFDRPPAPTSSAAPSCEIVRMLLISLSRADRHRRVRATVMP